MRGGYDAAARALAIAVQRRDRRAAGRRPEVGKRTTVMPSSSSAPDFRYGEFWLVSEAPQAHRGVFRLLDEVGGLAC